MLSRPQRGDVAQQSESNDAKAHMACDAYITAGKVDSGHRCSVIMEAIFQTVVHAASVLGSVLSIYSDRSATQHLHEVPFLSLFTSTQHLTAVVFTVLSTCSHQSAAVQYLHEVLFLLN